MEPLQEFTIPIEGLKDGMHQFDFQIDSHFFKHFENTPIQEGNFALSLYFDKRPDMLVLTFDIKGAFATECDRCLAAIQLPIKGNNQLLVKYADEAAEDSEVIYITRATKMLNVARYAYEYICLAIPMVKVYNCKSEATPPCNQEMLNYLDRNEPEDSPVNKASENPIWDALKDFDQKS